VFAAAVVSLFFTAYVPYVVRLTKIGQSLARAMCREIEEKEQLPEWLRFHTRVHEIYPPRRGQFAVFTITAVFVVLLVLRWLKSSRMHLWFYTVSPARARECFEANLRPKRYRFKAVFSLRGHKLNQTGLWRKRVGGEPKHSTPNSRRMMTLQVPPGSNWSQNGSLS
jgi:hypothetical protein